MIPMIQMIQLTQPLQRATQVFRRTRPYAIGAAWFFVVFSLAHLVWVVAVKSGNVAGVTTLYQTQVGDEVHRAWGLAYHGWPGLMLAAGQMVAVAAAAVLSVTPWGRGRRIGHAVLIGWSALWALDLSNLALHDGQVGSWAQATLLAGLLGCTVLRAACGGRASDPRTPAMVDAPFDDAPAAEPAMQVDAPATPALCAPDRVRDRVRATVAHGAAWAAKARTRAAGVFGSVASASDRLARRLWGSNTRA